MSAYGQSPCEWCRVMIEDREIHKCQRSDLREHIGDLKHSLEKVPASAVPEVSDRAVSAVFYSLKATIQKSLVVMEMGDDGINLFSAADVRAALVAAFGVKGKS